MPATRFAPSPNGELHLGHAHSAFVCRDVAERIGGRFLVRIEDIDRQRTREAHVAAALEILAWLGLGWEQPVLRQSTRFGAYETALDRLSGMGLLYPCFATRSELDRAHREHPIGTDPDGAPLYPGLYRDLDTRAAEARIRTGEPYALRLHMERAIAKSEQTLDGQAMTLTPVDSDGRKAAAELARPERWGDAVVARKGMATSYHLAVVVDDAFQGITHVVRGVDLRPATDLHRLLQVLLGLPEPVYHHHALILAEGGRKLSKSAGDPSLRQLREQGATPADIRAMIATHLDSR